MMAHTLSVRRRPLALLSAVGLLMGVACSARLAPAPSPKPAARPAPALVQVENTPGSRPQSGLQRADLVFEYLVSVTSDRTDEAWAALKRAGGTLEVADVGSGGAAHRLTGED